MISFLDAPDEHYLYTRGQRFGWSSTESRRCPKHVSSALMSSLEL